MGVHLQQGNWIAYPGLERLSHLFDWLSAWPLSLAAPQRQKMPDYPQTHLQLQLYRPALPVLRERGWFLDH